jgi:hypothetical protein
MPDAPKHLPSTNADGLPIVPMTDEQKYLFDLKGWLLLPNLLTDDQLAAIREHQMKFLYERESLPPEQRNNHGGPSQIMLDHPVLVGVLNEILSHQPVATEDCYGFRYDHTYTSHRKPGSDNFNPHGGGGFFNFNGNSHVYQAQRGQVHSGLTRCVWELNPVQHGKGGTLLLSGSHKTAFPMPKSFRERDCKHFETYECPGGSVLVFTEALCHSGTLWTNTDNDRLALFTCFNTVGAKWGGPQQGAVPPEVVASFPPKRQTLFRGVWTGMPPNKGLNTYYDEKNYAV